MYQTERTISAGLPVANNNSFAIAGSHPRDAYSYDYVTVEAYDKFAYEYVDCYEALGYELVKNERAIALKTALTFKRDRKIKNKEQLNKIQGRLDEALAGINKLEQSKTKVPFTAAIILGTAGTLTLGGGMSLCLLNGAVGAIIGGAALGIAGMAIAGLGYFAFRKLYAKKTSQVNPEIDKKRDEIGGLCEEAQKYLK